MGNPETEDLQELLSFQARDRGPNNNMEGSSVVQKKRTPSVATPSFQTGSQEQSKPNLSAALEESRNRLNEHYDKTQQEYDNAHEITEEKARELRLQKIRQAKSLKDILDAHNSSIETKEQREKRERKERTAKNIASALNMLAAVANVVTASKGRDGRSVPVPNVAKAVSDGIEEGSKRRKENEDDANGLKNKINDIEASIAKQDYEYALNKEKNIFSKMYKDRKEKANAEKAYLSYLNKIVQEGRKDEEAESRENHREWQRKHGDQMVSLSQARLNKSNSSSKNSSSSSSSGGAQKGHTRVPFNSGKMHVDIPDNSWKNSEEAIEHAFSLLSDQEREKAGKPLIRNGKHATEYIKGADGRPVMDENGRPKSKNIYQAPTTREKRAAVERYIDLHPDIVEYLLGLAGRNPKDAEYSEYFSGNQNSANNGSKKHSYKRSTKDV